MEVVKNTNLIPTRKIPEIPAMKNLWSKYERDKERREKEKKNNENKSYDRRNVYLVLGCTNFWANQVEPLHRTIKKIIEMMAYLLWLRLRMVYRGFRNLGEIVQADLTPKL